VRWIIGKERWDSTDYATKQKCVWKLYLSEPGVKLTEVQFAENSEPEMLPGRRAEKSASDQFSVVGNLRFTAPLFGEHYKSGSLMVREELLSAAQANLLLMEVRRSAFHQ
jgi:hypothetical protein